MRTTTTSTSTKMQAKKAYLINYLPKFVSFACNGVSFSVSSFDSCIPLVEFSPTQHTTALQYPLLIIEPASRIGSCTVLLEPLF